jgi:predicted DNA binding protein/tetratricopeptide (TPR) repeat protein
MIQITFRINPSEELVRFTGENPSLSILNWTDSNVEFYDLLTTKTQDFRPMVNNFLKERRKLGFTLQKRLDLGADTSILVMRHKHLKHGSSIRVMYRYSCLPIYPYVYHQGWLRINAIALDDYGLPQMFSQLRKMSELKIDSQAKLNLDLMRENFMIPMSEITSNLTPKQVESLLVAINHGYYQVPRKSRFEDISRAVKIPRTTYEDHVRKAESKVINSVGPYLSIYLGKSLPVDDVQHSNPIHTYFLRARRLLDSENQDSVKLALEFFSRVIERDHEFAGAYVGRAQCYQFLADSAVLPFVEAARKAEAEAKEALKIDPDLSEAHSILSHVYYMLDDFDEAEKEARKAVQLNPSDGDSYYGLGNIALHHGEIEEAIKLFETSQKLDPFKENNTQALGTAYLYSEREEEALKIWKHTKHLFPRSSYGGMLEYYMIHQNYPKAKEVLEKLKVFEGNDSMWILCSEGMLAAFQGDTNKALGYVTRIEHTTEKSTTGVNGIGLIYYALGEMDRFFKCMSVSIENHSLPGTLLRFSPLFAKAREDSRYQELLKKEEWSGKTCAKVVA